MRGWGKGKRSVEMRTYRLRKLAFETTQFITETAFGLDVRDEKLVLEGCS